MVCNLRSQIALHAGTLVDGQAHVAFEGSSRHVATGFPPHNLGKVPTPRVNLLASGLSAVDFACAIFKS